MKFLIVSKYTATLQTITESADLLKAWKKISVGTYVLLPVVEYVLQLYFLYGVFQKLHSFEERFIVYNKYDRFFTMYSQGFSKCVP